MIVFVLEPFGQQKNVSHWLARKGYVIYVYSKPDECIIQVFSCLLKDWHTQKKKKNAEQTSWCKWKPQLSGGLSSSKIYVSGRDKPLKIASENASTEDFLTESILFANLSKMLHCGGNLCKTHLEISNHQGIMGLHFPMAADSIHKRSSALANKKFKAAP